jgi:hypothetical protein
MPVLFFNESNLSVTEQMLAEVSAGKDSDKQAYKLNKLKPEHTYKLLDLPSGTILKLASMLGIKDIRDLMERLWRADSEDDLGTLGNGINFLNQRVIMAAYPGGAAPEFMDSLSLSMSNFIILWQALYNYLKQGDREVQIEWSETVALDSLPRGHRIPFLLAYDWLSMMLMLVDSYMEKIKDRKTDTLAEDLHLPVVSIQPEGESDEEGELLGYAVGIHKPGQTDYEIWLRLFFSGEVDFYFVPLWDESLHLQKIVDNLADLEAESRSTIVDISSSWKLLPEMGGGGAETDISSILNAESKNFTPDVLVRYRFGFPERFIS